MPAEYAFTLIASGDVPRAADTAYQHLLDVYASETNKVASIWRAFDDGVLDYRPHPKSTSVGDIFKHELLSSRRFFGGFLGLPEPDAAAVVPAPVTVSSSIARLGELARRRRQILAQQPRDSVGRAGGILRRPTCASLGVRRRVLHTAHHRTNWRVYLRLLDSDPVPPIYGPTADVTWTGADPTRTVDAARR